MTPYIITEFRVARACDCGSHGFVGLNRGLVAFVSTDDVAEVAKRVWCAAFSKKYMHVRSSKSKAGPAVVLARYILSTDAGTFVDHRNRDTLDNRRENLRECSRAENARNRKVLSATGFKGVTLHETGKYQAQIKTRGGKYLYLGLYKRADEAAQAYAEAARLHHGEFASPSSCASEAHI